jgi:hypothetical protein
MNRHLFSSDTTTEYYNNNENEDDFHFRRGENQFLNDAAEYIKTTYGQHYANEDNDIQLIDYWQSQDILIPTAVAMVQKYSARFGKKDGYNKKDLMKIVHYTSLISYAAEKAGLFE